MVLLTTGFIHDSPVLARNGRINVMVFRSSLSVNGGNLGSGEECLRALVSLPVFVIIVPTSSGGRFTLPQVIGCRAFSL